MNRYKIAKINIHDTIKPLGVYYAILCAILLVLIVSVTLNLPNVKGNMGGIDIATVVFIFICGLTSFKENFKFGKANNVSRKSIAEGLVLSCLPVALGCSILDLIINRIFNIFYPIPNSYEMCYGSCPSPISFAEAAASTWKPNNSPISIVQTIILEVLALMAVFAFGLLITSILYRCSKRQKVFAGIMIAVGINVVCNVQWIMDGISFILGMSSRNPYIGMITLLVLTIILSVLFILVCRKAQINK